jgi:integrase
MPKSKRTRRPKQRPRLSGSIYKRKGSANYYVAYCHNGRQVVEATHQADYNVAARMLREKLRTAGTPQHVTAAERKQTFDDVAALIRADYQRKKNRTTRELERILGQVKQHFAGAWLSVTVPRIEQYATDCVAKGDAPASVNRRLACLRRMSRLAAKQGIGARLDITLFPEDNARSGFVDPADFAAVQRQLPPDVADFVEWTYRSAWRRAMVESLCWHHCELQVKKSRLISASVRLPGVLMKNKTPYTLPVTGALLEVLCRRWAKRVLACARVFHQDGRPLTDFRTTWEKACEAAGFPNLLLHDLRRSAARNLRRAGVDESTIMRIGGWKTASMFRRYAITDDADVIDGLDKLDSYVARQLQAPRRVRELPAPAK